LLLAAAALLLLLLLLFFFNLFRQGMLSWIKLEQSVICFDHMASAMLEAADCAYPLAWKDAVVAAVEAVLDPTAAEAACEAISITRVRDPSSDTTDPPMWPPWASEVSSAVGHSCPCASSEGLNAGAEGQLDRNCMVPAAFTQDFLAFSENILR
jgi:hypothetical protein